MFTADIERGGMESKDAGPGVENIKKDARAGREFSDRHNAWKTTRAFGAQPIERTGSVTDARLQ